MNIRALKTFHLVNLVENFPAARNVTARRKLRVLIDGFNFHLRTVRLKFPADHLGVRPETMKRVRGCVDANKSMASLDPIYKRLRVGQRQITRRVREDDRVVSLQRRCAHLLSEHHDHRCFDLRIVRLSIRAFVFRRASIQPGELHREDSALLRHLAESFLQRGNGRVAETTRGSDHEHTLRGLGLSATSRAAGK